MKTSEHIWQSHETFITSVVEDLPSLFSASSDFHNLHAQNFWWWALLNDCSRADLLALRPHASSSLNQAIRDDWAPNSSLLYPLTCNTLDKLHSYVHGVVISDLIHYSQFQSLGSSDMAACGRHKEHHSEPCDILNACMQLLYMRECEWWAPWGKAFGEIQIVWTGHWMDDKRGFTGGKHDKTEYMLTPAGH